MPPPLEVPVPVPVTVLSLCAFASLATGLDEPADGEDTDDGGNGGDDARSAEDEVGEAVEDEDEEDEEDEAACSDMEASAVGSDDADAVLPSTATPPDGSAAALSAAFDSARKQVQNKYRTKYMHVDKVGHVEAFSRFLACIAMSKGGKHKEKHAFKKGHKP
jgi:hypothetical protein